MQDWLEAQRYTIRLNSLHNLVLTGLQDANWLVVATMDACVLSSNTPVHLRSRWRARLCQSTRRPADSCWHRPTSEQPDMTLTTDPHSTSKAMLCKQPLPQLPLYVNLSCSASPQHVPHDEFLPVVAVNGSILVEGFCGAIMVVRIPHVLSRGC